MNVYFEDFIFWNFSLDFLLLYLTGKLMRIKISAARITAASAFGAVYALCIFSPKLIFFHSAAGRIIISCFLILICFKTFSPADFMKKFSLFYLFSFLLGGMAFAMAELSSSFYEHRGIIVTLLISCVATAAFSKFINIFLRRDMLKKSQIFTAYVSAYDKFVKVPCFCDTGNCMQDSLSSKPVVILELDAVSSLFSKEQLDYLKDKFMGESEKLSHLGTDFCLLPFKSLGTESSFIMGFRKGKILLDENSSGQNASLKESDAVLGIYLSKLSSDGSFRGLANLQFFEENFYEKSFC